MKVMQRALELAFQHSSISVSVDMLSNMFQFRNPDWFYYSPMEIFRIAKAITERVVMRHDYMDSEFCISAISSGSRGLLVEETHFLPDIGHRSRRIEWQNPQPGVSRVGRAGVRAASSR